MLSFSISARGFPPAFFDGAFFCFLALGGVVDNIELELAPSSSSLSGFARFFAAGFVFNVVCVSFLAAGFVAAAFFAGAFAFGFYGEARLDKADRRVGHARYRCTFSGEYASESSSNLFSNVEPSLRSKSILKRRTRPEVLELQPGSEREKLPQGLVPDSRSCGIPRNKR